MQRVYDKIYASIRLKGRGAAFCNKDFMSIAARGSVDVALSNLAKAGKVRRLAPGLYDYPIINEELGGVLSPNLHEVAKAYARKLGVKIQPDGAWAANMLGLTTQVPARISYLTDGKSRQLIISDNTIYLNHIVPGKLQAGSELTVLVSAAIRNIGRDYVDTTTVKRLQTRLSPKDCKRLMREGKYMEGWIFEVIRQVAAGKEANE